VAFARVQDTAAILAALANVGQFPIRESMDGLLLRAYLKW